MCYYVYTRDTNELIYKTFNVSEITKFQNHHQYKVVMSDFSFDRI